MIITNHSAMPDMLAERAVKECIGAYEALYGKPSPDVEIILCSSEEALEAERLSPEEMAEELEYELGHPLQYRGEFEANGIPRMSDLETVEFVCVEETARATIPLIYAVKNRSATYEGAQLFGLVHAYYDFLSGKTGTGDEALILDPAALSLPAVIDIP